MPGRWFFFRKDLPRGLHTFATSDFPSRRGIPGCPSPAPPALPGPRAAAPPARRTRLALQNHRILSVGKDLGIIESSLRPNVGVSTRPWH